GNLEERLDKEEVCLECRGRRNAMRDRNHQPAGGAGVQPRGGRPHLTTFSTDAIPERDRLEHWREAVAKAIIDIDWCPLLDRPFQQRAEIFRLPGLGIVVGTHTSTGFIARRTPELISKGTDILILRIQLTGESYQSELGRETTVAPGDAILASSSDVGTVMLKPDSRFVALGLPRP